MQSKVTLDQLASPEFQNEFNELLKLKMPKAAAFKLSGIRKVAREKLSQFEEMRSEVIKKHAKKNDAGEPVLESVNGQDAYSFTPSAQKEMTKEVVELLQVEVTDLPTIKCSELGAAQEELTGAMVAALDGILLED